MKNSALFSIVATGVVLAVASTAPRIHAQVPETERQALIELYQATGGDDWVRNDGWRGPEGSECDWFGIRCEANAVGDATVDWIRLPGNNLRGSLPPTVTDLSNLNALYLPDNLVRGTLEFANASWPSLTTIDLANNDITAWQDPVALPGLRGLRLDNNRLKILPAAVLEGMPGLVGLTAANNGLESLDPVVENLTGLERLDLTGNRLNGRIPRGFWN